METRIYLRELTYSDVTEEYLQWFLDDTVTQFLSVDGKSLTVEAVRDYIDRGRNSGEYFMYAICLRENSKHIGNLKIGPINHKHKISDLVTVIGDREQWGKGLATEAIALGNKLAFEKYDIRKLTGSIMESNIGSIKAYTKAGWVIEGKLSNQYIVDGSYQDDVYVGCFNPKYHPELHSAENNVQ